MLKMKKMCLDKSAAQIGPIFFLFNIHMKILQYILHSTILCQLLYNTKGATSRGAQEKDCPKTNK